MDKINNIINLRISFVESREFLNKVLKENHDDSQ